MFPVAFGNDATVSVPVEVDLREKDRFALGERSGTWLDTWLKCIDDPSNGYFFIGGSCPTILHCVRTKTRFPGRVTATYFATPESTGTLSVFPLAHCLLRRSEVTGAETRLEFFVNGPEPSFLIMTNGDYWIDALEYEFHQE